MSRRKEFVSNLLQNKYQSETIKKTCESYLSTEDSLSKNKIFAYIQKMLSDKLDENIQKIYDKNPNENLRKLCNSYFSETDKKAKNELYSRIISENSATSKYKYTYTQAVHLTNILKEEFPNITESEMHNCIYFFQQNKELYTTSGRLMRFRDIAYDVYFRVTTENNETNYP